MVAALARSQRLQDASRRLVGEHVVASLLKCTFAGTCSSSRRGLTSAYKSSIGLPDSSMIFFATALNTITSALARGGLVSPEPEWLLPRSDALRSSCIARQSSADCSRSPPRAPGAVHPP